MQDTLSQHLGRRRFLHLAIGTSSALLLAGCGGGGGGGGDVGSDPVTVVSGGGTATGTAASPPDSDGGTLSPAAAGLNLALTLEYLGAQFYAYAATGTGIAASLTGGIGTQGAVTGGRQASLADPLILQHVQEVADDKLAHVTALRASLGPSAAAQPAIDFGAGGGGAFAVAAQAAGVAFDPFGSDAELLLGALVLEHVVAATYRRAIVGLDEGATLDALNANLAGAIYHGGLVRSLLSAKANGDPALTLKATALFAYMARLDGSDLGDQSLEAASGGSENIVDSDGHAIPFLRDPAQVLKLLYLGSGSGAAGGFLPKGANGVRS